MDVCIVVILFVNANACGMYFLVLVCGGRSVCLSCVCERNVFADKRDEAATTGSVSVFMEGSVSEECGCLGSVFEFGLLDGGNVYVVRTEKLF